MKIYYMCPRELKFFLVNAEVNILTMALDSVYVM